MQLVGDEEERAVRETCARYHGRPTTWIDMPLEWDTTSQDPVPLLLGSMTVPEGGPAFLFGVRHALRNARGIEPGWADGYFTEYVIGRERQVWSIHRLIQRVSTVFSAEPSDDESIDRRRVKKAKALSIGSPPSWPKGEAPWPLHDGEPMLFVGQLRVPDTKRMRALFDSGTELYLFWRDIAGQDLFKLVEVVLEEVRGDDDDDDDDDT